MSRLAHAASVAKRDLSKARKHLGSRLAHVQMWPRRDFSKLAPSCSILPVTFSSRCTRPKRNANSPHQCKATFEPSLDLDLGNKDKQILEFDPEIEQTLRKLRKQAKLQKQPHKISSEEVFEEVSVNMAEERDQ
ncbi:hypothetical protein PIB30_084725 [Stylosanthes scabra]|uniref:Uncharacterized protein n=1 Tax=Stylosanthes scabra TaxID=79078 RepID=A0ABU6RTI8_9FABA|nr:hypothetical protein [Stylosanthes scabra]